MKQTTAWLLSGAFLAVAVAAVEVPDWHAPLKGVQLGPDGQSMVQFAETSPWRVAPPPADADAPAATGGPAATAVYKNLKILNDVSAAEFDRTHRAMIAWSAPKQTCAFCHAGDDPASDANPMKGVTRDMIRLTRALNTTWKGHVGETGVTCFTCHRGEPMPPETWLTKPAKPQRAMIARSENWNEMADTVRKFFPDNGWSLYLLQGEPIRAESRTVLRGDTVAPALEVKRVYEMMMQMADGIGVNCGYCHASRSFQDWSQSTPARWIAHDAIRMTREINASFLLPLQTTLPQTREPVKVNALVVPPFERDPLPTTGFTVCATCHYGHVKPDGGAATLANYSAFGSTASASPATNAADETPAQTGKAP